LIFFGSGMTGAMKLRCLVQAARHRGMSKTSSIGAALSISSVICPDDTS